VALGVGLKRAGYEVKLGAPAMFETFVRSHGLTFAPLNDAFLKLKDTSAGKAALEKGRGSGLSLIKQVMPMLRELIADAWAAAQGVDAVIYHPKSLIGAHIAEALQIPVIMSLPLPLSTPTGEFPLPIMPDWGLGSAFNRFTYRMMPLMTAMYGGVVNDWRKSVNLPPRSRFASDLIKPDGSPMPTLYSFSPHVVPPPQDWNTVTHATGYWHLPPDEHWQPPAALEAFLAAGPAPVYIGFGSMVSADPEAKARVILDAVVQSGQRAVLATGWGALNVSDLPDNVYMLEEAPHEWLFPRMAAVVHHGGAGTTAAGLTAGKPTIICPFIADQPFWGRRVAKLGVGPAPIPQRKLTAARLADALKVAVSDSAIQARAAALGEKLRAEDGVANAVMRVKQYVGEPVSTPQH
jgi:sterol 3beta-glucosyltransferase